MVDMRAKNWLEAELTTGISPKLKKRGAKIVPPAIPQILPSIPAMNIVTSNFVNFLESP